ncbi:hypothetical protein Tco_1248776 [Tanacetum coccineum]
MDEAHASRYLVHPGADKTYYKLGDMYWKPRVEKDIVPMLAICAPFEALYGRKCRSPVLWAEIGESSLTRLELVQETTDKILERIGLVAYRLRLPEELNSVHDTFHVSNLKKCLADANLHVPLDEIKVDKTLRFVEEPVEIMDREIKKLKRRKIALVKVRWNSKRGPEFTWEHEDQIRL